MAMIVIDEEGYEYMLVGTTMNDMDAFYKWLENTPYLGCTGYIHFKVPKENRKVDVFIVSCDTKMGRSETVEYWIKKGLKYDKENMELLRGC